MYTTLDGFLKHFNSVRQRTRRVAQNIPVEHIEWAPRPGMFTAGDLVRHIAVTERYIWAESVCNRQSGYTSHGRELADGKEQVLAFLDRLHGESVELFKTLSGDALTSSCITPAGVPMVMWKWLQMMIEHEIHHRGQLYTTLGCLGIETPPIYGFTSQQARKFAGV